MKRALLLFVLAGCAQDPPDVPQPDYKDAQVEVQRAVEETRAVVAANPHSASAWGQLGDRLRSHDWLAEAARCYEEAVRLAPGEFKWWYRLGLSLEDDDKAIVAFRKAIAIDGYPPALVKLGEILARRGEGRAEFEAAVKRAPTFGHAHLGLGQVALAAGDTKTARIHLEKALALIPAHGPVHNSLSQLYRAIGDKERAGEHAARAAKLKGVGYPDPLARSPLVPAGTIQRKEAGDAFMAAGKLKDAEAQYRAILAIDPKHVAAIERLGSLMLTARRPADAEKILREAIEADPDAAAAHRMLGSALAAQGKSDDAIRHLLTCVRLLPESPNAYMDLGVVYMQRGDHALAVGQLRKALAIDAKHAPARLNLANALFESGQGAASVVEFRKVLGRKPNWRPAVLGLAWVLATDRSDAVRDGAEALRLARSVDAGDARALDVVAAALAETGNFPRATALAAQAKEKARGDDAAQIEARRRLYAAGKPYRAR